MNCYEISATFVPGKKQTDLSPKTFRVLAGDPGEATTKATKYLTDLGATGVQIYAIAIWPIVA